MDLSERLMLLSGLVIGLTFHECAHAWSAWKLGDGYARRQGRVTLNPLRHLDPLGTLAIFLLPFGWARPVPINLYNFRRPRLDYLLSSLAGPAANAVLVGACLGLMQLTRRSFLLGSDGVGWMTSAHQWLELVLLINVILGLLNLVPLPPLDGSKIWPVLIPSIKPDMGGKLSYVWVIVLVVLLQTGAADGVFHRLFRGIESITPDTDALRLRQLVDRGQYYRDVHDYPKAMAMFRAALEITERHPDAWIDAGAFGKGAGLEAAGRALAARSVRGALLDFGGQALTLGTRSEGGAWRIGVAHPARRREAVAELHVGGGLSVATSGGSERPGHLPDPRDGRQLPPWGSVTVVGTDPGYVDAVLGGGAG